MTPDLSPERAWEPLPTAEFDRAAAGHLLRRLGFSATPQAVAQALQLGLGGTLQHHFGGDHAFPMPLVVKRHEERVIKLAPDLRDLGEQERRLATQELRRQSYAAHRSLTVSWARQAATPAHSAVEKWVSFLQDVFVTALPKVSDIVLLFQHQDLLRRGRFAPYRQLCQAVSRSPAMIEYLDLQRSRQGRPNENFARELFELFMLGEGQYTEQDVKEAARAFTGYRRQVHDFVFVPRQHDRGLKTVFGKSGPWTGDDIIELALKQPAAATFLPTEMARFYLDAGGVPNPEQITRLGQIWRAAEFSLATLATTFFQSRYFFHSSLRAQQIKSPTHFYLGLLQDLHLHVPPFPGPLVNTLRQLGQPFLAPPNVRGWVGGRAWINSATLSARRQAIQYHFTPLEEENLNADDYQELLLARADGLDTLTFTDDRLAGLVAQSDDDLLATCFEYLLAAPPPAEVRDVYRRHLQGSNRPERVRELLITILESPAYQLC